MPSDSDSDSSSDDESSNECGETNFISKSGMEWKKRLPHGIDDVHIDTSSFPKVKNEVENINTFVESFNLFMSDDVVQFICDCTNKNLDDIEMGDKKITKCELYAFIGILLASGKNRSRKIPFSELWRVNSLCRHHYATAAMPRDRFSFIFSQLRFDDKSTRELRLQNSGDKMEAVKFVYTNFNDCCKKYIDPSHVTIDERLATFRGKCPFRVYMRSKPGRHGIKIWTAADPKTGYILNSQVYTGKVNNQRELNQGKRVTLELAEPYFNSHLGVTVDYFFTSIPLAKSLLEKNLHLTGTLRINKKEIPREFHPSRDRAVESSIFGYTDKLTMVSYVPQKNKAVVLLSSQIRKDTIVPEEKNKPKIILFYNKTKGAVDTGDKMTREYSCARPTRRWPFRVFMEIIDMAALNAYVIFKMRHPEWNANNTGKRKFFI